MLKYGYEILSALLQYLTIRYSLMYSISSSLRTGLWCCRTIYSKFSTKLDRAVTKQMLVPMTETLRTNMMNPFLGLWIPSVRPLVWQLYRDCALTLWHFALRNMISGWIWSTSFIERTLQSFFAQENRNRFILSPQETFLFQWKKSNHLTI